MSYFSLLGRTCLLTCLRALRTVFFYVLKQKKKSVSSIK